MKESVTSGSARIAGRTVTRLILLTLLLLQVPAAAQDSAWVVTSDYSSLGRVREFATTAPWSMSVDLAEIASDAIGRYHDGQLYIVGRGAANTLQVFDPAAGFALVREFSLGAGRNLQDIAFAADGTAYVSCYDEAVMLRIDVDAEQVLETFSTAAFADANGLPETSWMIADGELLYISCQRLDDWYQPTGPGLILVFDMALRQWVDTDPGQPGVQAIALQGMNPYTPLEIVPFGPGGAKQLRVGCAGNYFVLDGGIEAVNPATGTSAGFLVTEQDLGGDVIGSATSGPQSLHVLVSDTSFHTNLSHVDLTSGDVTVLDQANDYVHVDVVWDGDFQVIVADRTVGAAGLRIFDAVSGAELTTAPLLTGLPPYQIVWPQSDPSGAPLPVAATSLRLGAPYPNPCNPSADVPITGRPGDVVTVSVVDLRGCRLSTQKVRTDAGGTATFRFDGLDATGRPLPAAAYRITARSTTGFAARTLLLAK